MNDLTAAKKDALMKQGVDILLTRAWLMQHRRDLGKESFERLLDHGDADIIHIWRDSLSKLLSQQLDTEDSRIATALRDFSRNMRKQEEAVDFMVKRIVELGSAESPSAAKQDYNDIFQSEEEEESSTAV